MFPKKRRALILSILLSASAVGLGLGGKIGGYLSQYYDWRQGLLIVGLPGVLIGLLVLVIVPEPRRKAGVGIVPPVQVSLKVALNNLVATPSLRWCALTIIAASMTGFPFIIWSGSFYQQVHGMTVHETGNALFVPITGGLVIGNLLAGWLTDRFGKGNLRYNGRLACFGLVGAFPFALAMVLATDAQTSLACFFVFHVLITLHFPPMAALAFAQVPIAMRAMLGAAINMVVTLSGIGIGTFLLGALSDIFGPRYGELSLRYSMLTVVFSLLLSGFTAIMAGRRAEVLH
jgi:predicted MFS family arabinose efflux permease